MVRARDVAWAFVVLTLILAGPHGALADPINFTGNAAADFSGVLGTVTVPVDQGPGVIDGSTGSTASSLPAGTMIQNIFVNYDATTNQLFVGFQGYTNVAGQEEISGDDSGNPNPALDSGTTTNANGTLNNFGGLKSIAVAFAAPTTTAAGTPGAGTPAIIAGIPQTKSEAGSGLDGFTVSKYSANGSGLEFSFGNQIANGGSMTYNPSAAHPDFEFTINNFSQIAGFNPTKGFYIEVYDGNAGSTAGKVETSYIYVPAPQGITTPEPTTWLAWTFMAGAAAWRYRRRLVRS
jgi:hypothetical protein